MNTGDKIREAREARKIKQAELAEMIDAHPVTVSRWERNINKPDIEALKKIAKTLEVDVTHLIGDDKSSIVISQKNNNINGAFEKSTKQKFETENFTYWGGVLDKTKNVAERGNLQEISLISTFLNSACEMLAIAKNKALQTTATETDNKNPTKHVDIHQTNVGGKSTCLKRN